MAWTAPRTWVTSETVTAAHMNAHVRDNLLETSAATVTTAGDFAYADAANSMGSRLAIGAAGTVLASTGSAPVWRVVDSLRGDSSYQSSNGGGSGGPATYTDFDHIDWSEGTNVTVTVTTGTQALVWYGARWARNATAGNAVSFSYRVSGSTTVASASTWGATVTSSGSDEPTGVSRCDYRESLTAGSNTFTLQALVTSSSDNADVANPFIVVMAL